MTDLSLILKEKFGFTSFKKGQEETITSLLEGKNTLTILPTETGKSLSYQLPSYQLKGTTIIVSPLISLMEDQVIQLKKMGEKSVVALNSLLDDSSKQYALKHLSSFKFIFISPETLNQRDVFKKIQFLKIGLFVIDEAHCISEWGHDFRPSYLSLKDNLNELNNPLTLALTATATKNVRDDIKKCLFDGRSASSYCYPTDRPNIFYDVVKCENKVSFLVEFLKDKGVPGIIYFSSKKEARHVSDKLNEVLPYKVAHYHGDLTSADRIRIQQQFIYDDIRILCATSAFGMGINKQNIRFVIHYHLPDSIENYVQESGRAGRDGKQSLSIILYKTGDERIHHYLQEKAYNEKKELLRLKNKSILEIKRSGVILTDMQKRWLKQIKKNNWNWIEFEHNLAVRQVEKTTKTKIMLDYIETERCLRKFLISYFGDNPSNDKYINCCSKCQKKRVVLEANKVIKPIEINEVITEAVLKKLFLTKI